jgi:hypothetical protein
MIKRMLFTLALVASAGAAYAQGEPADPYGRPLIGRQDWVRQPGDQPGVTSGQQPMGQQSSRPAPMASAPMTPDMAAAPAPMASSPSVAGEPRDPYGRPLIGRNDWVRQPGDQQGPR